MSWTSPLGFPVTQPYKHYHKCKVETSLQNVGFYKDDDELSDPSMPDGDDKKGKDRDVVKVDKRAQTTAFPPNFIHSLDSTHMIMTAIECSRRGVAFAGTCPLLGDVKGDLHCTSTAAAWGTRILLFCLMHDAPMMD